MSAGRRAAGWAGALSLLGHAALIAAMSAALGRPGPSAGRLGVPGQERHLSSDVGVVALAVPESKPVERPIIPQPVAPKPLPTIPATQLPSPAAPPPLPRSVVVTVPEAPVRPASHQSAAPPTNAGAPGSPSRPSSSVAAVRGSDGILTRFFSVAAVGTSVVFVIDRSSSMGLDDRFERARQQVRASLRQLPAEARFQVIAYDKTALALNIGGASGLLSATAANVSAAIAALDAMVPEGGTDHVRALTLALSLQPDVIFFLTDQDDLTTANVRTVTQLNHGRVRVHALCLIAPASAGVTPMQSLARENRGVFRVAQ